MVSAIESEFKTIELLLDSEAQTRAVDAFAVSWVKLERQLRRLTGNLLFQHSLFDEKNEDHRETVRNALIEKRNCNHDRFIDGIYKLSGFSVKVLIGNHYKPLKHQVEHAYQHRNKILHGQQTGDSLSREDLVATITSIRNWCELLAAGSAANIGYDGFSRNSLRKNGRANITQAVDAALEQHGWQKFVLGL